MQHDSHIRERAYEIWEREGRPEGQHQTHWSQAVREIAAEDTPPPSAADVDPSPTVNAPDGGGSGPAEAASATRAVGQGQGSRQIGAHSSPSAEGGSLAPTITAPESAGASPGEAAATVKPLDHLPESKGQNGAKGSSTDK